MNMRIAAAAITVLLLAAPAAVRADDPAAQAPSLSGDLNALKNDASKTGQQLGSDAAAAAQGVKDNAVKKGAQVKQKATKAAEAKKKQVKDKMSKGETLQQRKARLKKAALDKAAQGEQKTNQAVDDAAKKANDAVNRTLGQ